MRFSKLTRLFGALCLAGSVTYVAAGAPASAATPRWYMHVENMPDKAANGDGVAYRIVIGNLGPSNISTLFFQTDTQASPTFRTTTQGTCSNAGAGPLKCTLGALNAGATVTLFVGYDAPASGASFNPGFNANSNGFTLSDGSKKTSHGDSLTDPAATATTLVSSPDFAGGFSLEHRASLGTNSNIGPKNIQSTYVVLPPDGSLVTTVEDGKTVTGFDCPTTTCFGEWSRLKVRSLDGYDATTQTFSPFEVQLTVRGSSVSGPLSSLRLVHVTDDGVAHILTQDVPCGDSGPVGCLTVTQNGNNVVFTTWVDQNGGFKGMG
jgi:hypothetical protein